MKEHGLHGAKLKKKKLQQKKNKLLNKQVGGGTICPLITQAMENQIKSRRKQIIKILISRYSQELSPRKEQKKVTAIV